jgi:ankyrin repeat protein
MFAAALGNRELVQFLLKQGMNPNLKSKAGKTASKVAADFGHTALADELEKAG